MKRSDHVNVREGSFGAFDSPLGDLRQCSGSSLEASLLPAQAGASAKHSGWLGWTCPGLGQSRVTEEGKSLINHNSYTCIPLGDGSRVSGCFPCLAQAGLSASLPLCTLTNSFQLKLGGTVAKLGGNN